MNKRWIAILAGVLAFFVVLGIGAMAGGTIAYLALKARPIRAALAFQNTITDTGNGLLVASVDEQGPAAQAGVVRGDILLNLDNTAMDTFQDLQNLLAQAEPGDVISLSILHGDETRNLSVTLGDKNGAAYLGIVPCLTAPHDGGRFMPNFDRNLPQRLNGALITQIIPGEPAEQAGLQVGDVILAVDGQELNADNNLADLIQSSQPGDTVQLSVQKAGDDQPSEVEVTLGENPDTPGKAYLGIYYTVGPDQGERIPFFQQPDQDPGNGNNGQSLPFEFQPFGGTLPGLPEGVDQAVLVSEVISGSPAAKADIQVNDVITAVDGVEVGDAQTLVEVIQGHKPGDKVALTVYRSGETGSLTINVTLGENPDKAGAAYMGVGIRSLNTSMPDNIRPFPHFPSPDNDGGAIPNLPGGGDA